MELRSADHVLDGTDAGDRIFGERKRQGHGTDEFSIDIDGAAAHSLHDPGVLEGSAGEAGEDDGLLGSDIVEDSQDLDLELIDAISNKNGPAGAVHAGLDVLQREKGSLGGQGSGQREDRWDNKAGHLYIVAKGH